MLVATFDYFPFSSGPGADSGEDRWVEMMQWMRTTGVVSETNPLNSSTDDLAVTQATGLQVKVAVGRAFMEGTFFIQTDDYNYLDIAPNNSGNDRIDLVVVETDFITNITVETVIEGTPDPSPVAPTPVQNDNLWQLPLAEVYVIDMAVSIDAMDITDVRVRSTQGDGGSTAVTLSSAGGDETLVADGNSPPDLETKGLTAGLGISLSSDANSVTITNTGTASSTSSYAYVYKNATTTGLTDSSTTTIGFDTAILNPSALWDDMTNPERITVDADAIYYIHARVGWVGVAMADGPVEIQIVLNGTTTIGSSRIIEQGTNTIYLNAQLYYELSDGDYLELDVINDSGQTLSLTSGTDGPNLQVIKLTATDALGVTLASGTADESLVKDGVGPDLETKGLNAGTNVSLSSDGEAVTINADTVTLASAGGSYTLVADGTGQDLEVKGLTAGAGITLNAGASSIEIVNSSAGSAVTLASGTGDESLVKEGTGPNLEAKALTGGTSISLTADGEAVTITNDSPATSVTLASGTGDESLVKDATGPDIEVKALSQGTGITLSADSETVTITASGAPSDSPVCFVYRNATTTGLTDTSTTTIDFDTAILNPDSMWENVTNPERITVDEDGVYQINAMVGWVGVALANGPVEAEVVLNGTTTIARSRILIVGADTLYLNPSIFYDLSSTDYLTLDVTNDSGQTLSLTSGADGPSLQAIKIRS